MIAMNVTHMPNAMETKEGPRALMLHNEEGAWYAYQGDVPVHPSCVYNVHVHIKEDMNNAVLMDMLKENGEKPGAWSVLVEVAEAATVARFHVGDGWPHRTQITLVIYGKVGLPNER